MAADPPPSYRASTLPEHGVVAPATPAEPDAAPVDPTRPDATPSISPHQGTGADPLPRPGATDLSLPALPTSGLRFPETLGGSGLLVGWSLEKYAPRRPIGFTYGDPNKVPSTGYIDPILLGDEGHLITIAPTGSGKGTGCIIPALLRHQGPVIVIDPKGENVAITARHRAALGQEVIVLDPMGITDFPQGRLNPLDLVDLDSAMAVDDAATLALAMGGNMPKFSKDPFWENRAQHVLIGCILHVLASRAEEDCNLTSLRDVINSAIGNPEQLIEEMRASDHLEVVRCVDALGIKADTTLAGILATAQEFVDFLRGPLLHQATASSSFDLDDVTRGAPLSIYIVLPPHMIESHGRILRLWISVLITAVTRRRSKPPKPTLFLLDEAAQLGTLTQLRQAITLLRGYGLQTWSFWQDVSQLELLYPLDWKTMVNNCRVLQCFGALNMNAANDMARITGFGTGVDVLNLESHEILLQLAGDEAVVARKPSYLKDLPFAGQFDANPYYRRDLDIMPKRMAAVQFYERTPRPALRPPPSPPAPAPAAAPQPAPAPAPPAPPVTGPSQPHDHEIDPLLRRLLDEHGQD
jgi:type IV secretion system protein VirD4